MQNVPLIQGLIMGILTQCVLRAENTLKIPKLCFSHLYTFYKFKSFNFCCWYFLGGSSCTIVVYIECRYSIGKFFRIIFIYRNIFVFGIDDLNSYYLLKKVKNSFSLSFFTTEMMQHCNWIQTFRNIFAYTILSNKFYWNII